jgi:hypothetical protein
MISAMTVIAALALLLAGGAQLVHWVRHDRFTVRPTLDVFE